VIPSAILGRYARSLAEVVFEENIEQKVTADLEAYNDIFSAVPEVLDVFHSPAVPRESKEKLLGELTERYPVHPVTFNFLRTLLQHNRIRYFEQIRKSYLKSVNANKGIVSAQVTSAAPLSPGEVKKLEDRLSGITGKLVNVESHTDPELLRGIVVQMGCTIFDGSVRTQLVEMKRRLAETK
jgi:F-type H+-transporting ATPase subunit delta